MRYYTAGGTVRDLLLGVFPKDHDVAFAASPQEFITLNPQAHKAGGPTEIFLLGGSEYTPLRGSSPQEDALERDLTINAFLLEENGRLHMHPNALEDLAAGRLHPASARSFRQDPLRVFRAARFSACLPGFAPSGECLGLMSEAACDGLLETIAPERVGRELLRALQGPEPGDFLRVLEASGCLSPWFSPLEKGGGIPAGPPRYHRHSVLGHTAEVMDKTAGQFALWLEKKRMMDGLAANSILTDAERAVLSHAVWMALCHDLGKNLTAPEILPHHYGHEQAGAPEALALAHRLALPASYRKAGALSCRLHMKAGRYSEHRPAVRVDLLAEAHAAGLALPLFLLAQADSGRNFLWELASAELKIILNVTLPAGWQNRGAESGKKLRDLRCNALARAALISL